MKHKATITTVLACLATLTVGLPIFDRFHGLDIDLLHWFRAMSQFDAPIPRNSPTVVVAIDEATHVMPPFKGIPKVMWTPQIAMVQSAVLAGGAKVFGWDIILPTSAGTYLNNRRYDQALLQGLANERKENRVVLGQVQLNTEKISPHRAFVMMAGGAKNLRNLEINLDADGISRSVPLFLKTKTKSGDIEKTSSMSMELATRALGQNSLVTERGLEFDGRLVTRGSSQDIVLNFDHHHGAIPTYSFADLFHCAEAGRTEYFNSAFAGKVVLFGLVLDIEDRKLASNRLISQPDGAEAPNRCMGAALLPLPEARSTTPGVYLHATAVNNLLEGSSLNQPRPSVRFSLPLITTLIAAFSVLLLTPLLATISLTAMTLSWILLGTRFFMNADVMPIIDPLMAAGLSAISTLFFRFLIIDKDRRFLRAAFSSYVSPNLVEVIVNDPDGKIVAARRQECTFIFTDLTNFTAMVESLDPKELTKTLNDYIDGMLEIIFKHDGTLDKIVGDAMIVMFSAPIQQHDHAQRGINCAIEIDRWADKFAAETNSNGVPMGITRIGVHSGLVIAGNFGGSRLFDYTAYGDTMNTAARLESVNKHLGTKICISAATVNRSRDFIGRPVGNLVLKGKKEGVNVFEPLATATLEGPAVKAYLRAFTMLEENNPKAVTAFADAASRFPHDPLIAFHHKRLQRGESSATVHFDQK